MTQRQTHPLQPDRPDGRAAPQSRWRRSAGRRATDALDLIPVGVAHFDRTGRFTFVNQRFCELLGCDRATLLSRRFQEVTVPEEVARCETLNARVADGEIPRYSYERRLVRPDGSTVWTRVTVSAARSPKGKVSHFVGVAEDLSDQYAEQAARRAAEERLTAALDASETGTFRWDIRTSEVQWDENCHRLFGIEPGRTVRSFLDFLVRVHEADRARVARACLACADVGGDLDEEFRIVRPDGTVRWLCNRGRTYFDRAGNPAYMTGAATDVTRLKRAELARKRLLDRERRARAEAERAIRTRDDVLAVVAHDLRNPLNTILMTASLIGEALDRGDPRDRYIGLIRRAATDMDGLVRDLLDLSRMEAGTLAITRQPVDLDELLRDCLELFEPQARPRRIALTLDVPDPLAPVSGDPGRIRQVISNLVGNALRFTPDGGRVGIRAVPLGDEVRVSIRDTGPGIAPEDQRHLFDRFWQRDTRAGAGAGLGLAIVRGVVRAHGGQVWVRSAPDQGTTFHFTLPTDRT